MRPAVAVREFLPCLNVILIFCLVLYHEDSSGTGLIKSLKMKTKVKAARFFY